MFGKNKDNLDVALDKMIAHGKRMVKYGSKGLKFVREERFDPARAAKWLKKSDNDAEKIENLYDDAVKQQEQQFDTQSADLDNLLDMQFHKVEQGLDIMGQSTVGDYTITDEEAEEALADIMRGPRK